MTKKRDEKRRVEKRVTELQPSLDPIIDRLDQALAENDFEAFNLLTAGIERVLTKALAAFKAANPRFDDTQTIQ